MTDTPKHYGRIEVRIDDDGRRFWWGGEDGWKDPTEIGQNGVLTINAAHFEIGTVITLSEPVTQNSDHVTAAIDYHDEHGMPHCGACDWGDCEQCHGKGCESCGFGGGIWICDGSCGNDEQPQWGNY